jgi:hypothetical protein
VTEFCNRQNFLHPLGFFVVYRKDGEVRFRHSVDVEGIAPTPVFVTNLIQPVFAVVKHAYPALQRIMAGYSLEAAIGSSAD